MSNGKEVGRDVDGMEVGGDDGAILGFKDDMELGTKYGSQLGIKHVVMQALIEKNIKHGLKLG